MRALLVVIAALLLALQGGTAWAHAGEPPAPHDLWSAWNWEPFILLGIALSGWFYGRGVRALWQKAGIGRGVSTAQAISFAAGLLALFAALVSPVDGVAESLFWVHMLQHLLLILVAAPLLVLGAPQVVLIWSLPAGFRQRIGRWWVRRTALRAAWHILTSPQVVWVLHAAALLIWHLPNFYQAALQIELVHSLEHASFFGTGLLFWWVLARCGKRSGLNYGAGLLYIFTTGLYSGILGALITFSRQLWYPIYTATSAAWGLTPLEDQQLAGVIMWVPGNLVYLVAVLALLWRWLHVLEQVESKQPV